MALKGFININKPLNMTSSDVVVKVRGILRRATGEKQKVGHLGTLDPLAIGVLPIAIGNATRLFDYMQNKQKTYIAAFKFGVTTDTLDRGGSIIGTCDKFVSKDEILSVLPKLQGEILQIPPQYSAKSVNGRRAYDIAREGGVADLKPKKIFISNIRLLDEIEDFSLSDNEFAFEITCGSGTYIRAIARDMAQLLNTVGYMTYLRRIETGGFSLENSVTFEELEKTPLKYLLPIDIALSDYDNIDLNECVGRKALNGIKVECDYKKSTPITVSVCGSLVGIGEVVNGKLSIKTRL